MALEFVATGSLMGVAFLLSSTVTGGMLFGEIIMLILRLLGIRD
jgi:hypothetical protein